MSNPLNLSQGLPMHTLIEVSAALLFFLTPCLLTNFTDAFVIRERRPQEPA